MTELELPDLFETAARATINERCASAFLHDVRGTMQALFSAFELLGRSAKLGGENSLRVEKACDLARRAISRHEKSTLDVLQILTLQPTAASKVDLAELMTEITHFLRNDAAIKLVSLQVSTVADLSVNVERAKLQTLLVGLLTAAIDATPTGAGLSIAISRDDQNAVISIGSAAGYDKTRELDQLLDRRGPLHCRDLTLQFARHFLAANGGHLEIDQAGTGTGAMRLYYPCPVPG